jgi:hypothetical protein
LPAQPQSPQAIASIAALTAVRGNQRRLRNGVDDASHILSQAISLKCGKVQCDGFVMRTSEPKATLETMTY